MTAAASQNRPPRSSAAKGTIQTTYWIEKTLLVTSSTSTDANVRVTTVAGDTEPVLRRSPSIRRQPNHPSSPNPTTVAAGSAASHALANGPATWTALNPNDISTR